MAKKQHANFINERMAKSENKSPLIRQHNFIVAIGASAGGLEAIHDFFDNVPENTNLAFIIIQHLSPDYKSLLVELVSKHTHMQVLEAQDGVEVQHLLVDNVDMLFVVDLA